MKSAVIYALDTTDIPLTPCALDIIKFGSSINELNITKCP